MNTDTYSTAEQTQLLEIARHSLEAASEGVPRPRWDVNTLSSKLREERACFVTLYMDSELRGCTGTLIARRCLADEVAVTTVQTALDDPRFAPVIETEVPYIRIEISVLTPSQPLAFDSAEDLLHKLRPNIDGVTLRFGNYRATFLPQVWEKIPDPVQFLTMLSVKMGLPRDAWRHPSINVETYQSIMIEEDHAPANAA